MIPTPELDKLTAIKDQSQTIGAFLDWYRSEEGGGHLCVLVEDEDRETADFFHDHRSIEGLLAKYFEIDLAKIEAEKLAILEELRNNQK